MSRYLLVADALWRLGLRNVAQVAWYRILLRTGIHPVQRVKAKTASGDHFQPLTRKNVVAAEEMSSAPDLRLFGWQVIANDGTPPDWHVNPIDSNLSCRSQAPWWTIADFSSEVGDIKYIWELSRMDWVVAFAQKAGFGDKQAISKLNEWLDDWERENPPFFGVNWKCGQETSIRVMHFAMALLALGQLQKASHRALTFIDNHLARIKPTLSYAEGQSNNHATSEAAALYIGGLILNAHGIKSGSRYRDLGRKRLHTYVDTLFAKDGSFSQYSINYHRVALDTLSLVEVFRSSFQDDKFADEYLIRARAATDWLAAMIMTHDGKVPILGHNDGASLLTLPNTDYSDYRPSVQLARLLFNDQRAFPPSPQNDVLALLQLNNATTQCSPQDSVHLDGGGVVILRNARAAALLKYPKFRFRPSQSDLLHVDLWVDGINLLRDGGTYSYNASPDITDYFGGVESHNSVQFDGHDQMPRLSRFLFGAWPKAKNVRVDLNGTNPSAQAAYTDHWGGEHQRSIELFEDHLMVLDTVSGRCEETVLRWRLPVDDWALTTSGVSNGTTTIEISADKPFDLSLTHGKESRYYGQMQDVTVLEARFHGPTAIKSKIQF